MRWFGVHWDAPVCEEGREVPTPVGELCGMCHVPIEEGDLGVVLSHYGSRHKVSDWPVHRDCLVEAVLPSEGRNDG